jgi:hypothetical protein
MSAQIKATPIILRLTAGQSAFHTLDRGTMIIVEDGVIHLKTQLYLAGLMFSHNIKLISGQSYLIEVAQYYQILVNANTKIAVIPPAGYSSKLWVHLISRLAPIRRDASSFLSIFGKTKI